MFRAVITDLAGTTLRDDGVVLAAFTDAVTMVDPLASSDTRDHQRRVAIETMGQSKIEVFRQIFSDEDLVHSALQAFEASVLRRVSDMTALPGVDPLIMSWRDRGIQVGVTTGFSRELLDPLLAHLGWGHLVAFSATPAEVGAGRPNPAMIWRVMERLGLDDPAEVVVVGDTSSDMEAGVRSGAGLVVGVQTGAHSREVLEQAGASVVVPDITHVDAFLGG